MAVNFALLFTTLHALFVLLQTAFIISNIIHGLSLRQFGLSEKLEFTHGMLWIARPPIGSDCRIIPQRLFRLDRARMTAPAYAFEVGRIVEQGQVAFMRLDVMNDR